MPGPAVEAQDPGTADPAVVIDDLRVVRGGQVVLDGLSCTLPAGRVTGLLGPNGSGKTTLMRCLVGVQRTAGGSVSVLGRPAGSAVLRRRIGYATQQPALYADLTVRETLSYYATVLGAPKSDVDRVAAEVGVTDSLAKVIGRLSGGQGNRVNLAVALLGSPELLVLDEPTVGTDPELREDLWALFRDLAAGGRTLLISSHVMDEAARCDHLLLMRDGALLAAASPGELLRHTGTTDLAQAFLTLVRREPEAASWH